MVTTPRLTRRASVVTCRSQMLTKLLDQLRRFAYFAFEGSVMRIRLSILIFTLLLTIVGLQWSTRSSAVIRPKADTAYMYVEVETAVYRKGVEISSENPQERRWYFSNVVEQPEDVPSYSLKKQKVMPYFSRNVMDPFEARGFSLDYAEQDVKVCGETSRANYETREEAVAEREKE